MHGCLYEGGDLHSVHASRESALVAVTSLLKEEADQLAAYRAEDSWWNDPCLEFSKVKEGFWKNNGGYISIVEHELLGARS
jgi:hypothetical protein